MDVCGQLDDLAVSPLGKSTSISVTGCWVGPKVFLSFSEKKKISFTCLDSDHDSSVLQPVVQSLQRLS